MEKKLYDASLKGDVEALNAMMREDQLILARVSVSSCFNETPLHLASLLGHFEFVKSLLSYKPDFVKRLDSQGRSPLHLASANGYSEIVKLLLEQDTSLCRVRDEDGRTPMQLAVMNSQYESVKELIKVNSDMSFHDEEEKVWHLCVMYNRLNLLILLMESIDKDLSHIKDGNGNTILHSAATLKRTEIIRYLVSKSQVDINEVNGNGLTALDITEQMPIDVKTIEIKELLIKTPARKVKNFSFFGAKLEVRDESILVAASVIAAIAYQSAISPPGGTSPYNKKYELEPGTSLIAYFHPTLSKIFWISNTVSFMASLIVIFLFVSGASTLKRRFFIWILRAAMWVTISAMAVAYIFATIAITPSRDYDTIRLSVWAVFVAIAVLALFYRLVKYIVIGIVYRLVRYIVIDIVYPLVRFVTIMIFYRSVRYIAIDIVYPLISYIVIKIGERIKK